MFLCCRSRAASTGDRVRPLPISRLPFRRPNPISPSNLSKIRNFDFLTLSQEAHERDLERELLAHLRQFLIELGVGFAFVGSQVPLEVGGEDLSFIPFHHLKLRCFIVIDLEDDAVQAGVRRQAQLLPLCRR